jgi:hypothetical protein
MAAVLATACFGIGLRLLGVVAAGRKVIATSRVAANCIRDPTISDLEKEKVVQKASLSLMGGFLSIVVRGAGALVVSVLPLLAFDAVGLVRVSTVTRLLATWQGILLGSVGMLLAYFIKPRDEVSE